MSTNPSTKSTLPSLSTLKGIIRGCREASLFELPPEDLRILFQVGNTDPIAALRLGLPVIWLPEPVPTYKPVSKKNYSVFQDMPADNSEYFTKLKNTIDITMLNRKFWRTEFTLIEHRSERVPQVRRVLRNAEVIIEDAGDRFSISTAIPHHYLPIIAYLL